MAVTGGELLVRTLRKAGVDTLFGLHGAHLETLFQAASTHHIRIVDTRHEAAAGHAAEGYARAARRLGVAMVTAGPGFTNVISSLANAFLDRTPVLYLSGSAGLRDAETNTLQAGIDQVAIAQPITKWAHRITVAQDIPRLVAHAIRIATSGPTGPVLLDLPADVLGTVVEEDAAHIPGTIGIHAPCAPNPAAIEQALQVLRNATRPIVMAGAGVWQADAAGELRAFAEAAGIPVFSDFQAHGLLPADHPLYGGTFHKLWDYKTERPDVVLALGVRFGLFTLGGSDHLVPSSARLIHVEIDPKEIGRLREAEVPIVADSREVLRALSAAMTLQRWPDWSGWQQTVRNTRKARRERLQELLQRRAPPIHPYQAVSAIVENIDPHTLVIGDGAESYHWLNEVIRQTQPGSYITHGFLGCVGFGLGLAIGAQSAYPDRPVLCLAGDGAIGFTIAEFDTMAKHALPIVVVIMNNRSWGASQHFQEIVSGPDKVVSTRLGGAKYHDVAVAFGCRGQHVTRIEDLGPAIREAFVAHRPTCINVEIDVVPLPPELEMLMARH